MNIDKTCTIDLHYMVAKSHRPEKYLLYSKYMLKCDICLNINALIDHVAATWSFD